MGKQMVVASLAAMLLVGMVVVGGCKSDEQKATEMKSKANDQVKVGMSVDQVKKILGEPSNTQEVEGGAMNLGGKATMMTWTAGDTIVNVTFKDDKVVTKTVTDKPKQQ